MTTATLTFKSDGVMRETNASIVSDGNAITLTVGYQPRRVRLYDPASDLIWEWVYGLPATNTYKFSSTGVVVDTSSAIVVTSKDTENAAAIANGTLEPGVTFSAGALPTGHTLIAFFE